MNFRLSARPLVVNFGTAVTFASLLWTIASLPLQAVPLAPVEVQPPFLVGPIKPDPARNMVYLLDATYNRVLAIDTTTGVQAAAASVDDGNTDGEIAVSVDDSTLYVAESNEDEILTYSLPSLTPTGTLTTDFPPTSIAAGANGRLFATEASSDGFDNLIVEVSTLDGSILQTFGSSEGYYYTPLIRTNATGTNLYANTTGISGYLDAYKYDVSGAQASAAVGYEYDSENLEDYQPDEANGRIYLMNGGVYGINVLLTANDNYQTVWKFTQPYATAVSYNQSASVVFGANDDEIREFNRTNGTPINDWIVDSNDDGVDVVPEGIAATANNTVVYVRQNSFSSPPSSILGFISTTGAGLTLTASIQDTITFNPIVSGSPGQQITLQGSDLSGLPITYQVVSGPAIISNGVLTFTGTGQVVISASTPGNAVYVATTKTQTIQVALSPQTISPFAVIANQVYHTSVNITKPAASSGLFVTVSVLSGPATISGNQVSFTGVGAVTLAANQAGNSSYARASQVTTSFLVTAAPQTISAFATIPTKAANSAAFTIVPPTASSGLPVTVSVQSGPATISGDKVTITGTGTVVLAANQAGNADYLAATTVTTQFTVIGVSQTIAAFKAIAAKTYTAVPFAITPPVATSKLPVTVSVLSGSATISGNNVTLTGVGQVILAANQAGNAIYAAAPQVTVAFTVNVATQTLKPFATIPTQAYGEAPFTIMPPVASSGLTVTVNVASGPAAISGDRVTITGSGTVTLTATQLGNADYSAAPPVSTKFLVKAAQTIFAFASINTQTYGEAAFAVTPPTTSAGLTSTVTVLSGPAKIAANKVTLTGAGTVVLAANQVGNANVAPATQVTTSFSVNQEAQTIAAFKAIPNKLYGVAAFAVAAPAATSKLPVTLSVLSGPATITAGKVTIIGVGPVTLAANQAGNTNFSAAPQVTTTFSVNPAAQTIGRFAAIAAKTTTSVPFVIVPPVATSKLAVTVTVLSGPAMISGDTVTLTGATGTVVLAANQAGDADYNAAAQVTTSVLVK